MQDFLDFLKLEFKDPQVLNAALTHPSHYSGRQKNKGVESFERLEFLGDRILNLCASEILYTAYPHAKEGELAKNLSKIVCKEAAAHMAKNMGIDKYLLYGRINKETHGQWETLMADAFEAVLGAIYLDQGFECVRKIVRRFVAPLLTNISLLQKDSKSLLQEVVQKKFKTLPHYKLISQEGPPHNPTFVIRCRVNTLEVTEQGTTKKEAQNKCAKLILEQLKG